MSMINKTKRYRKKSKKGGAKVPQMDAKCNDSGNFEELLNMALKANENGPNNRYFNSMLIKLRKICNDEKNKYVSKIETLSNKLSIKYQSQIAKIMEDCQTQIRKIEEDCQSRIKKMDEKCKERDKVKDEKCQERVDDIFAGRLRLEKEIHELRAKLANNS